MDSSTIKRLILVCFLAVFFFSSENNIVKAAPKIRASKGQVDTSSNGVRNSNNQMSCYETIPCGWALYSTERRQPFRRISTYTRNRLWVFVCLFVYLFRKIFIIIKLKISWNYELCFPILYISRVFSIVHFLCNFDTFTLKTNEKLLKYRNTISISRIFLFFLILYLHVVNPKKSKRS